MERTSTTRQVRISGGTSANLSFVEAESGGETDVCQESGAVFQRENVVD